MVQLRASKGLPKRTQRGGKAFRDEAGRLIADVATIFIDPPVTPLEIAHNIERVLEALSPELLDVFSKQFVKQVGRDIRRSIGSQVEGAVGDVIEPISRYLCKLAPQCTSDTISAEVAKRKGTTIQGAHAWMLTHFLLGDAPLQLRGGKAPLQAGSLWLLELDAKFSCIEHGDADEMLRFYPKGAPYPGARDAIIKGCARGKRIRGE